MTMQDLLTENVDALAELLVYEDTEPEVGFGSRWSSRVAKGVFYSKEEAHAATVDILVSEIPGTTGTLSTGSSTHKQHADIANHERETSSKHPNDCGFNGKSKWAREVIEDKCPKCGSNKVLLTNRATGKHFFGCSAYPDCSYTEFPKTYHRYSGEGHLKDFDGVDIDELEEDSPGFQSWSTWGEDRPGFNVASMFG